MEALKVRFADVKDGWMSVSLMSPERSLEFFPTYTPYDSILELVNALFDFLSWSESESVVRWNEQPNEYQFVFVNVGGKAEFKVYEISQRVSGRTLELVLSVFGSHLQIALPFWRALRDLETNPANNYETEWKRSFPSREMASLTVKVKESQQVEL